MVFFEFLSKSLNKTLVVELKNGVEMKGKLISIDKNLNLVLDLYDSIFDFKTCFIRGNTVKYISFIETKENDLKELQLKCKENKSE